MKPSVQDATHYDRIYDVWYKVGETIAHYWDCDKKGWARSAFEREDLENEGEIITAQEALERGCKYPQYPTTTQEVIVDSTPSGEVSGASETKVADESELQRKISEAISHQPYLTYDEVHLLRSNGYKVNSAGVTKMGGYEFTVVNEPLIPDMTEANDRKQRVETSVTSANNRQVGGDHYKKMKIQPWAADEAWLTHEQFVGHLLGSAIDYLARFNADAPGKGGIRDIEKAKHCLEKLIEVKRGAASADVADKH